MSGGLGLIIIGEPAGEQLAGISRPEKGRRVIAFS